MHMKNELQESMSKPLYSEAPPREVTGFFEDLKNPKNWEKTTEGVQQDCVTHAINISAGAQIFSTGLEYH